MQCLECETTWLSHFQKVAQTEEAKRKKRKRKKAAAWKCKRFQIYVHIDIVKITRAALATITRFAEFGLGGGYFRCQKTKRNETKEEKEGEKKNLFRFTLINVIPTFPHFQKLSGLVYKCNFQSMCACVYVWRFCECSSRTVQISSIFFFFFFLFPHSFTVPSLSTGVNRNRAQQMDRSGCFTRFQRQRKQQENNNQSTSEKEEATHQPNIRKSILKVFMCLCCDAIKKKISITHSVERRTFEAAFPRLSLTLSIQFNSYIENGCYCQLLLLLSTQRSTPSAQSNEYTAVIMIEKKKEGKKNQGSSCMRTRWTHVKLTLNFPRWLPLLRTNSNKLYRQIMCIFHVWLYSISLKRTHNDLSLAQPFVLVACHAFYTNYVCVCKCVRLCVCIHSKPSHRMMNIARVLQNFHLLLNHYVQYTIYIHMHITFSIPAGIFALFAILW